MWPFKKIKRIEDQDTAASAQQQDSPQQDEQQAASGGDSKLSAEIIKIKAELDQFGEIRKVTNERFTRINEQIGELRAMIMDANRSMQEIEVKTVKAVDLVEAVHPDKLMVEVRKQDAKIEALKASIESNEAIMKSILDQLKDMRHQIAVFRGLEQVVTLSNDVKKEVMNIKKIEANVERHADKVEGIFVESQKRAQDFEKVEGKVDAVDKHLSNINEQLDQIKVKVPTFSSKKELEDLIKNLNDFEKHVGNVIDLLTKRANDLPKDVNERFSQLERSMNKAFSDRLRNAQKANDLFEKIERNAPRIAAELRIAQATLPKKEDGEQKEEKAISAGASVMAETEKELTKEHTSLLQKVFKKEEKKEEKKPEAEKK